MTQTGEPTTPIEYQDSITGGLYSLKSTLTDAIVKTDRLIERSMSITPKNDAPKTDPPKSNPPGSIPKLPVTLALIGLSLASICVAAGYPNRTKDTHVTSLDTRAASAAVLAGKAAMLKGDYREAIDHFADSGVRGAAAEAYLPWEIECRLSMRQYGIAESLCAELANANPRNQSLVPYYRGACLYGLGRTEAARREYAEARKLGHPGALDALRVLEVN